MAEIVNVGTAPNSGNGDPLRGAMQKLNTRFLQFEGNIDLNHRYQGAAASDPSVRLNGDPIQDGDWYLNTGLNRNKLRMSGVWVTLPDIAALDLSGPSGSSLIGFLQEGVDAVLRTAQQKSREVIDLADFGEVDLTGVVDATAVFTRASAAAAARGKGLRLPSGVILLDPVALPPGLSSLVGRGKMATVLRFARTTLADGAVLLTATNNTAAIALSGFTIDCDDAIFKSSGVKPIDLSGSDGFHLEKVRIVGRGDAAVYADGVSSGDVSEVAVSATGSAGSSFVAALYMSNASNVTVRRLRISGSPGYGGGFAVGCTSCSFIDSHIEDGTAVGFGFWFDGASRSSIESCTARNTYAEAFQITNGSYNFIGYNSASWDNTHGIDAGISVHATAGNAANYNIVFANTLDNSKHSGLLVANNAVYNLFESNILRQCGVRGTAAGQTGSAFCAMAAYTDIAGANCSTNTFRHNKIIVESGGVTYGYGEFNNGGSGSAVVITRVLENEFHAAGGSIATRYLFAAPVSSFAADIDWQTFVPAVAAGTGSLGGAVANSASFRRRSQSVEMTLDITVSSAGSGAGPLVVTWAGQVPIAVTNSGVLAGQLVGGKGVIGIVNSNGVALTCTDGTTPIASGARIVMSGSYRVA